MEVYTKVLYRAIRKSYIGLYGSIKCFHDKLISGIELRRI